MPITLTWQQIALRITLALIASFLIGYDRGEHGKTTGIRTTMLVCLAATLAMLQANLLMNTNGKPHDSFAVLDLMRMPLGILTGIGFIGAGAILRKDGLVHGLTTAATLWYVTVLGLLFGGGQLKTAVTGTAIAVFILWVLKRAEANMPTHRTGTLFLEIADSPTAAPTETELRLLLHKNGFDIIRWNPLYRSGLLSSLTCDLGWLCKQSEQPATPATILALTTSPAVSSLTWDA